MANFEAKSILKEHPDVVRALQVKEVQEFAAKYELDFTDIQLNEYQGTTSYTVTIPVKGDSETVLLVAFDKEDPYKIAAQLIKVYISGGNLAISFNSVDNQNSATGIYNEKFELLQVETKVTGEAITVMGQSCFIKAFNNLPWFMKAVCEGSCATCFGAIAPACAACAGCVGGTALHCVL